MEDRALPRVKESGDTKQEYGQVTTRYPLNVFHREDGVSLEVKLDDLPSLDCAGSESNTIRRKLWRWVTANVESDVCVMVPIIQEPRISPSVIHDPNVSGQWSLGGNLTKRLVEPKTRSIRGFEVLCKGAVGCEREQERSKNKRSSYGSDDEVDRRVKSHRLSGFVHGLRGSVHTLLGDKIVFLALGGFGFASLAGIGLGLILDNFNLDRSRKRLGWLLFTFSVPAGALCLLLGLP